MKKFQFAIIGAGAAGIAAAGEITRRFPDASCALIERDSRPGGILLQCIHSGFGLEYFKEEMTGPEYAQKAFNQLDQEQITMFFNTTVTQISTERKLLCHNPQESFEISFENLILATGSRETPFSVLAIPSERPAGIFGAGEAQLLINRHALRPGSVGVILGAGDIGLIMARRLVYEGMKVAAVVEIAPQPGGVKRNVQTCIYDLRIPLFTESTLIKVHGKDRVCGVSIARVNKNMEPDFSSQKFVECDFVLSAIGLLPEIALAKDIGATCSNGHLKINSAGQTSIPWLYACGNAAKIFPIVDEVSLTAEATIEHLYEKRI
jgi:thioredoxin reductase